MIEKLKLLIEKWEKEHDFLTGPDDPPGDRAIGRIYGECAESLKAIIASQQPVEQTGAEPGVCEKCGKSRSNICLWCGEPVNPRSSL